VTVDHHDQMRRAGRFLWVDWAQASGRSHSSPGQPYADRFEGEHDGYKRFGVTHRRTVQWLAGSGWVIVDDMEGSGVHDLRLHWLAADLPYQVSDSPFQVDVHGGAVASSLEHFCEFSGKRRDRTSGSPGRGKFGGHGYAVARLGVAHVWRSSAGGFDHLPDSIAIAGSIRHRGSYR
jgi:hypothetical protein